MGKKILVIDDDIAILEVIKIILEEKNYDVITVNNGALISSHIQRELPDLILLDIWMSGYDGRDVAIFLKSQKRTQHIPIIIISANNETELIAKDCRADGFLAKPFDIHDLIQIIENTLK